jgi:purine nucleoside phosphorylase
VNLKTNPQTAAARLKKISHLRPTLAIVLGSGFHHVLNELRVEKSPLHGGIGWIKVVP